MMSAPTATPNATPADTTSKLAAQLRDRASRRAARSVESDLAGHDAQSVPATPTQVGLTRARPSGDGIEPDRTTVSPDTSVTDDHSPGGPAMTAVESDPSATFIKPASGRDGRLDLRGERISKMTLELPPVLVDALARWERDETATSGQRAYRERLIDCALTRLPSDIDALIALARALPEELRGSEPEQVGTRVRESIQRRLRNLRPELRVRRVRDVYLRHIYAAAIYEYLRSAGVQVHLDDAVFESPRVRETENRQ